VKPFRRIRCTKPKTSDIFIGQQPNMTTKSLFNIILKVLGIFFLKDVLATVPQIISVFLYFSKADTVMEGVWTLLFTIVILAVYCLVSYYLIFRSDLIMEKLRLDQGFDQEIIPLNIHRSTVLSISIIVIGGLMVAENIPALCRQLFAYYQEKRMTYRQTDPSLSFAVMEGVKIVIGLLLIGNQRLIVKFIELQQRKNAPDKTLQQ
jgi:hypothetical protein